MRFFFSVIVGVFFYANFSFSLDTNDVVDSSEINVKYLPALSVVYNDYKKNYLDSFIVKNKRKLDDYIVKIYERSDKYEFYIEYKYADKTGFGGGTTIYIIDKENLNILSVNLIK